MEEILTSAMKAAEAAEVFQVSSEETQVQFEANRLKHLQTKQRTSVSLRLIKKGRTGYASTTGSADGRQLVDNALETAQFGAEAKFELPSVRSFPSIDVFDPAVETFPIEDMVSLGESLVTAVTRHTPGIICDAGVNKGTVSVKIINSRGGQASYRKSFFTFGIEGNLVNGTDMLFVGDSESSCRPIKDTGKVTREVLQQLELARERASAATQLMPVVFTPNAVAGALVLPLMSAFNGKIVLEGASPIGQKLGQAVFNAQLSLYDDPTIIYRPGSRPCDDEGVPSQRTPLIEQGVVTHFLYDLQTAGRAKTQSTGNGNRGGGLPAPAPSAFIITPGTTPFEEMVRNMKTGLVVEQLLGAEQGNILGGDFSGNILLGYKVENGKMVGRVKDTMVSGNVYQILKQDIALGKESRWVGGFLQTPHIYCPGLSVATKG